VAEQRGGNWGLGVTALPLHLLLEHQVLRGEPPVPHAQSAALILPHTQRPPPPTHHPPRTGGLMMLLLIHCATTISTGSTR